ncbi:MAG TPA: S41 family peptidase [Stellaceae bacterium]|nr:S41 family peptidase [Stellaceae bacterium]
MTSKSPTIRTACRIALVLPVVLLGGCSASGGSHAASSDGQRDLALIHDVMQRVKTSYVHPVDNTELTTDALKGMLTRLDPHSDYMDAQEFHEFDSDTEGRFGGLGIEITNDDGVPKVIAPIDDTPAARAGIEPGDLIIRIDGQATNGMGLMKVVEILRGKPGTHVTITVARAGRTPFDVPLTRRIIHVASVKSALEPDGIGYARISSFTAETQAELTAAIAHLKQQSGGHLNGFVLDLRDDPGGLLDAAVEVAGDFLDGGTVVTTRGRESDDDQAYTAPAKGDLIAGAPMAVLVNGASASAAEIVAGALQDRHRATVMGTPSFGKGSVQTIIPIGHGAIRLTTALYYTPSGRSIQGNGITPDIAVGLPKDEQVANAVLTREADLHGAFRNAGSLGKGAAAPAAPPPNAEAYARPIKLALIGTKNDAQLAAAVRQIEKRIATHPMPSRT